MGREIGARTLVSEIGQSVDLPVKARWGPRSSRLAPWWLPKAVEPTAQPHRATVHCIRCARSAARPAEPGPGAGRRQERRGPALEPGPRAASGASRLDRGRETCNRPNGA
jgi:hypothetical protein